MPIVYVYPVFDALGWFGEWDQISRLFNDKVTVLPCFSHTHISLWSSDFYYLFFFVATCVVGAATVGLSLSKYRLWITVENEERES